MTGDRQRETEPRPHLRLLIRAQITRRKLSHDRRKKRRRAITSSEGQGLSIRPTTVYTPCIQENAPLVPAPQIGGKLEPMDIADGAGDAQGGGEKGELKEKGGGENTNQTFSIDGDQLLIGSWVRRNCAASRTLGMKGGGRRLGGKWEGG